MIATTMIPTVHDMSELDAKDRHWPPRMTVRDKKPTNDTQLIKPKTSAGMYLW